MLCDVCKKNEATVHIKEFHNGKCESHHLCAECAGKKEQQGEFGSLGFKLSEILFNTAGAVAEKSGSVKNEEPIENIVCPVCQWDTRKIRESGGKVGCPECYKVFSAVLADAFSKIQRGTVHLGKHPGRKDGNDYGRLKQELMQLQTQLADFVAKEEYEKAAVCRDRITAVKQQLESC